MVCQVKAEPAWPCQECENQSCEACRECGMRVVEALGGEPIGAEGEITITAWEEV